MSTTEFEFDDLELYSEAFGKYNQDSMIMDVCRLFDGDQYVTDINNFTDKEKITLFHEYMHMLHATTTIFGLSYFDVSIALWHEVRSHHDVEDGVKFDNLINTSDIKKPMELLVFWRGISTSLNQKYKYGSNIESIKIKSVLNPQPLQPIIFLTCDNEKLELGFIDISECAAFLLEQEFSKSMGMHNNHQEFNVFPYKIAIAIAKHINNKIKDSDIIYYLLASLQTHDPAYAFVMLLFSLRSIKSSQSVREQLAGYVRKQIRVNKKWVSRIRDKVQKGFPLNGYIGRAVKGKFNQISRNLLNRRLDPFFEINFAKSFSNEKFNENILKNDQYVWIGNYIALKEG